MYCQIVRSKNGFDKLYPCYEIYLEIPGKDPIFLMSARKRKKSKNANYIISTDRITSAKIKDDIVGKVRSNFIGTEFTVYDDGYNPFNEKKERRSDIPRRELASIIYVRCV